MMILTSMPKHGILGLEMAPMIGRKWSIMLKRGKESGMMKWRKSNPLLSLELIGKNGIDGLMLGMELELTSISINIDIKRRTGFLMMVNQEAVAILTQTTSQEILKNLKTTRNGSILEMALERISELNLKTTSMETLTTKMTGRNGCTLETVLATTSMPNPDSEVGLLLELMKKKAWNGNTKIHQMKSGNLGLALLTQMIT